MNPDRPGDPALTVDLQLDAVTDAAAALRTVWLEYADDIGTGRWLDTWQPIDAGGGRARFVKDRRGLRAPARQTVADGLKIPAVRSFRW